MFFNVRLQQTTSSPHCPSGTLARVISLSPPRLAFLAWGDFHACSRFAPLLSLRKNEDYSQSSEVMFRLYRIAFARARKSYRIGSRFAHINTVISLRSCAAPHGSLKWRVTSQIGFLYDRWFSQWRHQIVKSKQRGFTNSYLHQVKDKQKVNLCTSSHSLNVFHFENTAI